MYGQIPANSMGQSRRYEDTGDNGAGRGVGGMGQSQPSQTTEPAPDMMPQSDGMMMAGGPGMTSIDAFSQGPIGGGLSNPGMGQPGSEGAGGVGEDPSGMMMGGEEQGMMGRGMGMGQGTDGGGMMGEGMDPSASGMPMDPLLQAREQFQQLIEATQLMGEMYPAAAQAIEAASNSLVEALLLVAESIQRPPIAPPVAV